MSRWMSLLVVVLFVLGCGGDATQKEVPTEADIPALVRILENESRGVVRRGRAAERLGMIRSPKAIKPLSKAASNKKNHPDVRIAALDALVKIGEPEVIPEIAKLADDSEARIRERVMLNLSYFRTRKKEVEPTLTKGLKDKDENVRRQALESLNKLNMLPPITELKALLNDSSVDISSLAADMLYRKREEEGADRLILEGLKTENVGVLRHLIRAAGELELREAVERLIELTKSDQMVVRDEAARALGNIRDPRAEDALISLLDDDYTDVTETAVEALQKIGGLKAIDHLITMLEHRDDEVRMKALKALDAMQCRDERFMEKLRWMAAREPNTLFREEAKRILARIEGKGGEEEEESNYR